MSNPELIRQEVDELVGDIKAIVEAAIAVGAGTKSRMELALIVGSKIPTLLMNGIEFQQATKMEKIDYGLEGFDALTGTDEHTLAEKLPYVSAENTEKIFDMMKDGLREYFTAKFASIPDLPGEQ